MMTASKHGVNPHVMDGLIRYRFVISAGFVQWVLAIQKFSIETDAKPFYTINPCFGFGFKAGENIFLLLLHVNFILARRIKQITRYDN
jgi:hypothetical protein